MPRVKPRAENKTGEIPLSLAVFFDQWIDDTKPQRRHECEREHRAITAGQLRAFFAVTQQLVTQRWVMVMVAMTLEMNHVEIR